MLAKRRKKDQAHQYGQQKIGSLCHLNEQSSGNKDSKHKVQTNRRSK